MAVVHRSSCDGAILARRGRLVFSDKFVVCQVVSLLNRGEIGC